jgi:hypothetical protein
MSTPTWPDFETTIVLRDGKPIFVRAKIEGRLCNIDYKSANYLVGQDAPNYPVPALPLRDLEYLYLLSELAKINAELRELREEKLN